MPELSFITLDVFTRTHFRGNPLAVVKVPSAVHVSQEQMQTIAKEFNLSETVFLHERQDESEAECEWRLNIFTTKRELPFAGHPTIGTACYALGALARNAANGRLLAKAGPIELQYADGVAKAAIPHDVHVHTEHVFGADDLLEAQPALKDTSVLAIDTVSPVKGMNFVCVELPDLESLALPHITGCEPAVQLDRDWAHGFIGLYLYVRLPGSSPGSMMLRTRMIEIAFEDAATGSAACGLSSFLALKSRQKVTSFAITQGVEMNRESNIGVEVTLNDDCRAIQTVQLSGSAVQVMEGTLHYE